MFLTYPNQDTSHVFLALWDLDGSQDFKKIDFQGEKKFISGFRIKANQMTLIRMNPTFRDRFFFKLTLPNPWGGFEDTPGVS